MNNNQIRIDQIQKQFKCLKNPLVRVTALFPKGVEGFPWNLCKDKNTDTETFWTLNDVIYNLPLLSRLNLEGRSIFITPIENDEHIYMLIDDVRPEFYEAGFRPNLLIQTSQNKAQAVFVLPFRYPQNDRRVYKDAFTRLNVVLYGDRAISGLKHPFRLLGFSNPKPEHQRPDGSFPYVKLVSRSQKICQKMVNWIDEFAAPLLAQSKPDTVPAQTPDPAPVPAGKKPVFDLWRTIPTKPIHGKARSVTTSVNRCTASVRRCTASDTESAYIRHAVDVRDHDLSATDPQVDFRVAQRLLITGHDTEAIANAISRLSGRQRRDNDNYAVLTVKNAMPGAAERQNKKPIFLRVEHEQDFESAGIEEEVVEMVGPRA